MAKKSSLFLLHLKPVRRNLFSRLDVDFSILMNTRHALPLSGFMFSSSLASNLLQSWRFSRFHRRSSDSWSGICDFIYLPVR